jgi:hypothetical protein
MEYAFPALFDYDACDSRCAVTDFLRPVSLLNYLAALKFVTTTVLLWHSVYRAFCEEILTKLHTAERVIEAPTL